MLLLTDGVLCGQATKDSIVELNQMSEQIDFLWDSLLELNQNISRRKTKDRERDVFGETIPTPMSWTANPQRDGRTVISYTDMQL